MSRLFRKILLAFWITLLVTGLVTGFTVWIHQKQVNDLRSEVVIHPSSVLAVKAAANTLRHGGVAALKEFLSEQRAEAPDNLQIYAVDDNGEELLGRPVSNETLKKVRETVTQNIFLPIVREAEYQGKFFLLFAPRSDQWNAIAPKNRLPPPRFSGIMLILIGIVVSLFSSILLAWYFSRPIQSLRNAFSTLEKGDLSKRVGQEIGSRRDELADLGHAFDSMANQLQNLLASQKRLLHDVSHELRSPLTRMQAGIGLISQQPQKVDEYLPRIELEIERLDRLVAEILTLSRLESGAQINTDEYLDVQDLLSSVVDDARFEAKSMSRGIHFNSSVNQHLIIRGHGELLYRAFDNVVRNALHHTPTHSDIEINMDLDLKQSLICITVDDRGPGVNEQELADIFEPFKTAAHNSHSKSGYGLGLAIARRAIQSHSGTIFAVNLQRGGLRITISIPYQPMELDQAD